MQPPMGKRPWNPENPTCVQIFCAAMHVGHPQHEFEKQASERLRNQKAIREFRAVGCGACKGTGREHAWKDAGWRWHAISSTSRSPKVS